MRKLFTPTFAVLPLMTALLLLTAVPVGASEREPTPDEVAEMIVNGTPGEHVLVAAWLEKLERAEVAAVFDAVRKLKARGTAARRIATSRSVRATKERPFRLPLPEKYRPEAAKKINVINAEVRVIDVPAKVAVAFLGEQRPTPERKVVSLSSQQAQALLRAVENRADVKLVCAPRITVYSGQKANVSVLNEISYIQDFDVETAQDGTEVANPIVQTIQEGTVIDFTPSLAGKGTSIGVRFEGTYAAVTRPIPELERALPGGAGKTVKVQLPELRVQRIKATTYVPDDGWVLIGGAGELEPKKGETVERVALLHLRSLEIDGGFLEDLKAR